MYFDIDMLECIEIICDLCFGVFDVLVGINLLCEGFDIFECVLVVIFDVDKEGFLCFEILFIQIIGCVVCNVDGKVVFYVDYMIGFMEWVIVEINCCCEKQFVYNVEYGIMLELVKWFIGDILESVYEQDYVMVDVGFVEEGFLVGYNLVVYIVDFEKQMCDVVVDFDFEIVVCLCDEIKCLQEIEFVVVDDVMVW